MPTTKTVAIALLLGAALRPAAVAGEAPGGSGGGRAMIPINRDAPLACLPAGVQTED